MIQTKVIIQTNLSMMYCIGMHVEGPPHHTWHLHLIAHSSLWFPCLCCYIMWWNQGFQREDNLTSVLCPQWDFLFMSIGKLPQLSMAATPAGWPAPIEIHTPWNQGPSAQWQTGISGGPDLDKCATSHLVAAQKLWSESDSWRKYIP